MSSFRKVKKSKKKMIIEENPEQMAKKKLIEFSDAQFEHSQSQLTKNPDLILESIRQEGKYHKTEPKTSSPQSYRKFSKELRKISDPLVESRHFLPINLSCDGGFYQQKKSLNVSLKHPLTVSNFFMMGSYQTQRTFSEPKTAKSQYILRQQRNASRIRRQQLKKNPQSELNFVQLSFSQRKPFKKVLQ